MSSGVCMVAKNSSQRASWRFCSALSQPNKPAINVTTRGAQSLAAFVKGQGREKGIV